MWLSYLSTNDDWLRAGASARPPWNPGAERDSRPYTLQLGDPPSDQPLGLPGVLLKGINRPACGCPGPT